jgi:ferredoxin/flavodoxin---NADP+ reductase
MTSLGTDSNPLRVAIIGAGPSGFYAADALFKTKLNVQVDAFDKLPTPFGLLRGGIAPDHQQMKTVGKYYDRIASKNADSFNFFGNVEVGKDISIEELKNHYHALIFSYGSASDKKTGLPGEDLNGCFSAREFVGWYNGHPDYVDYKFDLSQEDVAIIGQGNVAVDVARILAKTVDELKTSDIAQHALDQLAESNVKRIHIIGRRGPVQAAFNSMEAEELGKLEDCDIIVKTEDLILNEANQTELDHESNNKARKNFAILKDLSEKPLQGKSKQIEIRFFQSPYEITGSGNVTSLECDGITLEGEAFNQKATKNGEKISIPSGLLFRSIGYKGEQLEDVPFDEKRGTIINEDGRVKNESGEVVQGLYTSGWIKRGPSGVLGTNKPCSTNTVNKLIEDINNLIDCKKPDSDAILDLLKRKNVNVVTYEDWQIIDKKEVSRGEEIGKPREKFVSYEALLKAKN